MMKHKTEVLRPDEQQIRSFLYKWLMEKKALLREEMEILDEQINRVATEAAMEQVSAEKSTTKKPEKEKKERASFPKLAEKVRNVLADGYEWPLDEITKKVSKSYKGSDTTKLKQNIYAFLYKEVHIHKALTIRKNEEEINLYSIK